MSDSTITVKLSKAITLPTGESLTELKFREPTATDIERCGNPVVLTNMGSAEPKVTFDAKPMTAMLSVLSGQLPPVIGKISANDWNTAAWALSGFFVPIFENAE